MPLKVGLLKSSEVADADRIVRLAFGTFLGLPDPGAFMGDRNFVVPRCRAKHTRAIAVRDDGRLIGTNILTRWGSFGFFGPLTVLPEYWGRGAAQRLLDATVSTFDKWGLRHTGLYTFANSAKHVNLYQKFGYWPRYLTAIMTRTPDAGAVLPVLLSGLQVSEREMVIASCFQLTGQLDPGLDLTDEIRAALAQRTGDIVLTQTEGAVDAFAICLNGAGTEGGSQTCYIKFGAARRGKGAGERFERLLEACEGFAASRGANVEAGVNLAREDAYLRMRARGYRIAMQGVAMQRPHAEGFNRADVYVVDDWR